MESKGHGMKFAIIENEFGEVGVDENIIKELRFGQGIMFFAWFLPCFSGSESEEPRENTIFRPRGRALKPI